MKYSQALVVAIAGGAALVAAAPAASHRGSPAAPATQEPAVARDLEDFFERSLDEESLLEARHHDHQVTNEPQARDIEFDDELLTRDIDFDDELLTRDIEFDDELLTREFGSDNELSTRDVQQLNARMFEFILRIFSKPWWSHPLDQHHHHGHHHHHHHGHHHHHHHDNKDKQFVFPHGHSNQKAAPDATHKSETHAPAASANSKQPTPEPPAGAPTPSPAAAAAANKEVNPVTSARAAAPSAATPEPTPQQTPPDAQAPLAPRHRSFKQWLDDTNKAAHQNSATRHRADAAKEDILSGGTGGTGTLPPRSFLDEEDLVARASFGDWTRAALKPHSSASADPNSVVQRSYDDDLAVRDLLDALEAVKRTYAADDLDARSFDDLELDQLD